MKKIMVVCALGALLVSGSVAVHADQQKCGTVVIESGQEGIDATVHVYSQKEAQDFFGNGFWAQAAALLNKAGYWKSAQFQSFKNLSRTYTPVKVTIRNNSDVAYRVSKTRASLAIDGQEVKSICASNPTVLPWQVAGYSATALAGSIATIAGLIAWNSLGNQTHGQGTATNAPAGSTIFAGAVASCAAVAAAGSYLATSKLRKPQLATKQLLNPVTVFNHKAPKQTRSVPVLSDDCYVIESGQTYEEIFLVKAAA